MPGQSKSAVLISTVTQAGQALWVLRGTQGRSFSRQPGYPADRKLT